MRFLRQQENANIPVYGLEAYTHNAFTAGFENWWQEKVDPRNGILWHKESIINEVVSRIPEKYDVIAFIDPDLEFTNKSWATATNNMLTGSGIKILQPYSTAVWTNSEGKIIRKLPSSCLEQHKGSHPGFAWAAQRSLWIEGPGLFDYCLAGSGDIFLASGCLRCHPSQFASENIMDVLGGPASSVQHLWKAWEKEFWGWLGNSVIGYVPGDVIHEWHGDEINRTYIARRTFTKDLRTEHLIRNDNGLLQWTGNAPKEMVDNIKNYFITRQEDGKI